MTDMSKNGHAGAVSRSAALLMAGTVVGQLAVLAGAPFLTRLFTPEQFGTFGVYVSIFAFFNIATSLRYELATPLPKRDAFALNILTLCFLLTIVTAIVAFGVSAVWGERAFQYLGVEFHSAIVWILPLGLLFSGGYKAMTFWAFRTNAFRHVAVARVFQGAGLTIMQVCLGVLGIGSVGLIWGHAFGFICASFALALVLLKASRQQWRALSAARMLAAAKRYRNFPIFSSWSDLINVIGSQFPTLFIAAVFSPAIAGFYLLANRVANAPVAVVAEATSKSLLAAAAKKRGTPELAVMSGKAFRLLLRTGLGPMAMIALIAPNASGLVFGEAWVEAGTYLRLLILWTLSVFVFVPLMSLYTVLELQKQELVFQALIFVARVLGLVVGAMTGSIHEALLYFSVSAAASYSICGLWILRKTGVKSLVQVKAFLTELGFAAVQVSVVVFSGSLFVYFGLGQGSLFAAMQIGVVTIVGLGVLWSARKMFAAL